MKVLKFGGTSVGSVESILSVKKIVESQDDPVIVVVSALGGVTDQLIRTSQMAVKGDASYHESFSEIVTRHRQMVDPVISDAAPRLSLWSAVSALFEEL